MKSPPRNSFAAILVCATAAQGCRVAFDWNKKVVLRSGREGLAMAGPGVRAGHPVLAPRLAYITLAVDRMVLRNARGLMGRHVAVGVEVLGLLPEGRIVQTLAAVTTAGSGLGLLVLDDVAAVGPVVYTGRLVSLRVLVSAIAEEELADLHGRLAVARERTHPLDPSDNDRLALASQLYHAVFSIPGRPPSVAFELSLPPSAAPRANLPALAPGQYVVLALPPPDAPADLRRLTPESTLPHLALDGHRLIWRHDRQEYIETPYVSVRVVGHARQRAGQRASPRTAPETHLSAAWSDIRAIEDAAARARGAGDHIEELRLIEREVHLLGSLVSDLGVLLFQDERLEIRYRLRRLLIRGQIVGRERGLDVRGLLAAASACEQRLMRLPRRTPAPAVSQAPMLSKPAFPPPERPSWKRPHQRWWFWTLIGAAVAGAGALVYGLTRPAPPAPPPSHLVDMAAPALLGARP